MLGAGWAFPPRILVVLRIGGDVGFGVAAAANIMQDCTAVPFGSCTLTEQHQSVSCRSCLRPSQPRVVHASVDVEMPHEHIYLHIMVLPYSGSSALEGLLASSPTTTTICKMNTWQCEYTWLMADWHVPGWSFASRWEPPEHANQYWGGMLEALQSHHAYDYPL